MFSKLQPGGDIVLRQTDRHPPFANIRTQDISEAPAHVFPIGDADPVADSVECPSFAVTKDWQNGFGICWKEIRYFTAQDFGEHHDLGIIHAA